MNVNLSLEEYKSFIKNIEDTEEALLFEILYWCGLRINEVYALTRENVNDQIITINNCNGKVSRQVIMPKSLAKDLSEFLKNRDDIIFQISTIKVKNTLLEYFKNYAKGLITIHIFRSSHIMLLNSICTDDKLIRGRIGLESYEENDEEFCRKQFKLADMLDKERNKLFGK